MTRDEIMQQYRVQQEQNAREEARRRDEIRVNAPDIAKKMDERHQMILRSIQSAFTTAAPDNLEKRMEKYNQEIHALLLSHGYPDDYLEPVFQCSVCHDTGYVGEETKRECACLKRKLAQDTVSSQTQTFELFDETVFPDSTTLPGRGVTQRGQMRVLRGVCQDFADAFPSQQPPNLLLYGTSGLGKTYLLSCIANRVRERGFDAMSVSAYQALVMMRDQFFGRASDADRLMNAKLLILDDLGMEPLMENVTLEQIYNLLETRRAKNLPMVISTNLTLTELKSRYTERISSRLLDVSQMRVIRVMGEDVRLIKR